MEVPEEIIHEAPSHLRIPVINTRKETKEDSRSHHVVEVTNHVISVVQVKVSKIKGQW